MTLEELLQDVVASDRDTDVLAFLDERNIAWRDLTTEVLLDIHNLTKGLLGENGEKGLELRLAFLIRYVKDLEFKVIDQRLSEKGLQ